MHAPRVADAHTAQRERILTRGSGSTPRHCTILTHIAHTRNGCWSRQLRSNHCTHSALHTTRMIEIQRIYNMVSPTVPPVNSNLYPAPGCPKEHACMLAGCAITYLRNVGRAGRREWGSESPTLDLHARVWRHLPVEDVAVHLAGSVARRFNLHSLGRLRILCDIEVSEECKQRQHVNYH